MEGLLVAALLALAAAALMVLGPKSRLLAALDAAAIAEHVRRAREADLERRLAAAARHQAAERVTELGRECEDNLISANLAMQLRLPNMAAAHRRAAERCAREALSRAHEVGA